MKYQIIKILGVFLIFFLACSSKDELSEAKDILIEKPRFDKAEVKSNIIGKIHFYAWWWSESQILDGFDADNPPPKKDYIELENWNGSGVNDFPHPDKIDIVCSVMNESSKTINLKIVAKVDFKTAPHDIFLKIQSQEKREDELQKYNWQDEQKIGESSIIALKSGALREIKFKDFDLRKELNKSLLADEVTWLWRMRVRIYIYDETDTEILQQNRILKLIPAD